MARISCNSAIPTPLNRFSKTFESLRLLDHDGGPGIKTLKMFDTGTQEFQEVMAFPKKNKSVFNFQFFGKRIFFIDNQKIKVYSMAMWHHQVSKRNKGSQAFNLESKAEELVMKCKREPVLMGVFRLASDSRQKNKKMFSEPEDDEEQKGEIGRSETSDLEFQGTEFLVHVDFDGNISIILLKTMESLVSFNLFKYSSLSLFKFFLVL